MCNSVDNYSHGWIEGVGFGIVIVQYMGRLCTVNGFGLDEVFVKAW